MYIFSFNTDPAISDHAVGIGVPTVQYDSPDAGEENANMEREDGKMFATISNKITVKANFKSNLNNQQSKPYSCFLLNTLYCIQGC